jgi:hypothetical protein
MQINTAYFHEVALVQMWIRLVPSEHLVPSWCHKPNAQCCFRLFKPDHKVRLHKARKCFPLLQESYQIKQFWPVLKAEIGTRNSLLAKLEPRWKYSIHGFSACASVPYLIATHYLARREVITAVFWNVTQCRRTGLLHPSSNKQNKLRGVSPRANYTDRATGACRRS